MVTYVALPYQTYRLTGSSLAVGLLGLAELVPLLVAAFVGGVLADSVDRRRLVIAAEAGLASGCGLLMVNAARAPPSTPSPRVSWTSTRSPPLPPWERSGAAWA